MPNPHPTTPKTLLIIILSIMVVFSVIGGLGDTDPQIYDYVWRYEWFGSFLFLLAFFYLPLLYLYHQRKKKNQSTLKINKVFRVVNCFAAILFILPFLFELFRVFYYENSYSYFFRESFWHGLGSLIKYLFSPKLYILNTEFGLLNDLKSLLPIVLYYLPFLAISVLFFIINKINKKNETIPSKV